MTPTPHNSHELHVQLAVVGGLLRQAHMGHFLGSRLRAALGAVAGILALIADNDYSFFYEAVAAVGNFSEFYFYSPLLLHHAKRCFLEYEQVRLQSLEVPTHIELANVDFLILFQEQIHDIQLSFDANRVESEPIHIEIL